MLASLSTLAHHGVIYVPLGYAKAFAQLTNLSEVHGGTCYVLYGLVLRYHICLQALHGVLALSRVLMAHASRLLSNSRSLRSRERTSTKPLPRRTSKRSRRSMLFFASYIVLQIKVFQECEVACDI